jgi:GntP family gluconate:H+ symporter
MSPFAILLIGMVVVVGAVLLLRLHAFLALIGAAVVVAILTPTSAVHRNEIRSVSIPVVGVEADGRVLIVRPGKGQKVEAGATFVGSLNGLVSDRNLVPHRIESVSQDEANPKQHRVRFVEGVPASVGDRIVHRTRQKDATKRARLSIGERVGIGLGNTCLKIGILIAMAAIIGKCLLDSGAAERIVLGARRLMGEKGTPAAFLASGFTVGIPVFFDTVFYLLLPMGKAMAVRAGKNYLLFVLCIVAGATMAHSLVPPTPGPLFVAGELGVDVGVMMIGGIVVGLITVSVGFLYARWANLRWQIPLRPSAELSEEDLKALAERDESQLPPLWISILPILIPVVLIAGGTILKAAYAGVAADQRPMAYDMAMILGNKNIALIIAAVVALGLFIRRKGRTLMLPAVQSALESGGVIILITAAGGAFGMVLRQTGIAEAVGDLAPAGGSAMIWLPIAFGLTMLVRIAQGSATVAMITSVGIVAPIVAGGDLGFHPLYLALAIGCGSKPIPWMNDSGFWIISKMSGMTEAETLKTASVMMSLMGFAGLGVTLVGAWILPLV